MDEPVTLEMIEGIAVIRLDDGKVNALSHQVIDGVNSALDEVEAQPDTGAVVIFGRPGRFSAGFDLNTIKLGGEAAQALVNAGARMAMRIYGFPRPVVAGCTGHAIAAGAIMLLASDVRIGVDVEAKVGLNEVSIGMPLPVFAVELARARLSRRHFTRATTLSTIYTPAASVDVGYLDEVVDPDELESRVMTTAADLRARLSRSGFAITRHNDRHATIELILASLDDDLADFEMSS